MLKNFNEFLKYQVHVYLSISNLFTKVLLATGKLYIVHCTATMKVEDGLPYQKKSVYRSAY